MTEHGRRTWILLPSIGPVDGLRWQLWYGCSLILGEVKSTKSPRVCHWQAEVVMVSFWQHFRNHFVSAKIFVARNTSLILTKLARSVALKSHEAGVQEDDSGKVSQSWRDEFTNLQRETARENSLSKSSYIYMAQYQALSIYIQWERAKSNTF